MVDRAALRREFERAYRLLPRPFADEAVRTSMQRLRLALGRPTPTLKWADFGAGGRFLRGGGASVADYAAQRIGRAQEDPDVAALSAAVDEHGAQPGRMIMDAAGERFFWFVPVTTLGADPAQPAAVTRGFVVDLGLFAELAHHFNAGAGLTPAEMRVLFQLTAGAAPREAAALDGVSLETKRAQLKSAAAKLQCGGQTDLVRLMLGQMTHLLSMADSEAGQTALAERWVARHLPPDMRLRSARLEDGRVLRCIECGAPDGAPVVAVHGMMFGMLLRKAGPHLRRHGVRLLTPLRPGFLDARPALGAVAGSDLTDAAVAEIRAAIDVLVGGPVKLLGHSLGALTARVVASRHPGAVSILVMLSANLPQSPSAPDSGAGQHYGGYAGLERLGSLARLVTSEYRRFYADPETCRLILRGMFGANASDAAALEPPGASLNEAYGWFIDCYETSIAGMADDFRHAMAVDVGALIAAPPPAPVHFIHGADDPLTAAHLIARWAASAPGAITTWIAGGGHFVADSHPDAVWRAVAAA